MEKNSNGTDDWVSDMKMELKLAQVKIDRLGEKITEDNDNQNLSERIDELQWKHDRIRRRMDELLQVYGEIEKEARHGMTVTLDDLKADIHRTWKMSERQL
jgi:chromosome segregation ATPase